MSWLRLQRIHEEEDNDQEYNRRVLPRRNTGLRGKELIISDKNMASREATTPHSSCTFELAHAAYTSQQT